MSRISVLDSLRHHESHIVWGAGLFSVSLVLSVAAVIFVVLRLPEHYFHIGEQAPFWADRPALLRWLGYFLKNLAGVVLVSLGVVMSLPGVPGQGLLTIFIGLVLLDFPGKKAIERRIAMIPGVLRAMNRLRERFGKKPLSLEHKA